MKRLAIVSEREIEPQAAYAGELRVDGLLSCRTMAPPEFGLWLYLAEVDADAVLTWPSAHGDEGVFVVSGELAVEGVTCPAGGAVIVESQTPAVAIATTRTTLAHFGSVGAGSHESATSPGRAHVVGPRGWFQSGQRENVRAVWFADSTCPTCEISLFLVEKDGGVAQAGPAHSHSADELIYVLSGSIRLGSRELSAGTCLAIPKGVRYTLSAGPDGHTFLNYRPGASEQTYFRRGERPRTEPEGGLVRGGVVVGDLQHVAVGS